MAWFMNQAVKARVDGDTLKIYNETIYDGQFQLEVEDDDVAEYEDIKRIFFMDCFTRKLPDANSLLKIAPNFDRLILHRNNIARICSLDLRGFRNLVKLDLEENDIEELPSDIFIHTPNLQHISFVSNKIKVIGEDILEPLKNLKIFDLRDNPGIDVFYELLRVGDDGRPTLSQFKEALKRCKPVRNVWINADELENLKSKFEAQEKEIIDLKKHCNALKKELEEAKQAGAFGNFDFTIEINGKMFKVQKEILAANSPLLAEIIRENEDADTLELEEISEKVFEEVWNFMLKKTPPKPTANFMEIYAASGLLQMTELNDFCAQTLMGKVTRENASEIMSLCEKYPNFELGMKVLDEVKKMLEKP